MSCCPQNNLFSENRCWKHFWFYCQIIKQIIKTIFDTLLKYGNLSWYKSMMKKNKAFAKNMYFHQFSCTLINVHVLSSTFMNSHKFSSTFMYLTLISFHVLSSTFIDFHELINFHQFSWTLINVHVLFSTSLINILLV